MSARKNNPDKCGKELPVVSEYVAPCVTTFGTVAELIAVLQLLPPTMRIGIAGYEGGYNIAGSLEPAQLALNCNDEWYYGSHEKVYAHHDPLEYADRAKESVYIIS